MACRALPQTRVCCPEAAARRGFERCRPGAIAGIETPWLDGERSPVMGFLGQVARWKAPHLIIEMAERLADRPDVRFVIVGDVWFPQSDAATVCGSISGLRLLPPATGSSD